MGSQTRCSSAYLLTGSGSAALPPVQVRSKALWREVDRYAIDIELHSFSAYASGLWRQVPLVDFQVRHSTGVRRIIRMQVQGGCAREAGLCVLQTFPLFALPSSVVYNVPRELRLYFPFVLSRLKVQ